MGDLDIAQHREDSIEGLVQNTPNKRHVPLDPSAVNDVIAFRPSMIKLLDQFGGILQIAVEKDAGLHDRHFHPARKAICEPKLRECVIPTTCGSVAEISTNALGAIVGASVIHKNDLVIDVQLLERIGQPPIHDRYGRLILVAGDNC